MANEPSEFELLRLRTIESNRLRMDESGLTNAVTKTRLQPKEPKPRVQKKRQNENTEPLRKSQRDKNQRVPVTVVQKLVRANIFSHSGKPNLCEAMPMYATDPVLQIIP